MSKVFITGRQGSGKTTVIKSLQKRGFTAYNTDEIKGVTELQDINTGEIIEWPKSSKVDWSKYAWNWQKPKIEELLNSDENVFLGAVVSNQTDFISKFNYIFFLSVDENTLRKRLSQHEHESHHLPGEIDRIAKDHIEKQQRIINRMSAIVIDASITVDYIVDEILKRTKISLD